MLQDRGPFRRVSLKSYISRMSTPNPKGLFDTTVAEILEQQGFAWEESPRSVYDPQQLYTALERYATDWSKFEHMDRSMAYGFSKAFKIFAKPKSENHLKPLTDAEVTTKALKLEKSSGLPLMKKKSEALHYSFDREYQIRLALKAPNPCVAYKRTQADDKTRLIWGYPQEMTVMEARFARPLIDRFINSNTPMAFGMSKCELGAKIHRYLVDRPGTTVCLDYSKFDSTISAVMIKQAFRILSTWFTEEDRAELGWDIIVRYFISTPIVMPDGHLYTGKNHGVPSGSYFTQLIDSIVNVAMMYSLQDSCDVRFDEESLYVLGDDVIVQVTTKVELKRWAKELAKHGLILHDDKKTLIGEAHFLGAFWEKGKPDIPVQEIVNKACFPESFRDYQGNPGNGAKNVLRSYASSYLSGFRFLPIISSGIRSIDLPEEGDDPKYLSGSDKFVYEERKLAGLSRDDGPRSTLATRLLL